MIHAVALADTRTEELLAKVPVAVIPLDRALAATARRVQEALKAAPLGPPPDTEGMWRKALERLDREIAEAHAAAEAVRRAANPLLRLVHDPAKAEQAVVDRLSSVRVNFVQRNGEATSRIRDVIWKKSSEYADRKRIYDARKLCLNRIAYAFEVGLDRRRVEASLVSYQLSSAGFPNIADQLEALSEQAPRTPKRQRSQRRQIQRGGRDIS